MIAGDIWWCWSCSWLLIILHTIMHGEFLCYFNSNPQTYITWIWCPNSQSVCVLYHPYEHVWTFQLLRDASSFIEPTRSFWTHYVGKLWEDIYVRPVTYRSWLGDAQVVQFGHRQMRRYSLCYGCLVDLRLGESKARELVTWKNSDTILVIWSIIWAVLFVIIWYYV